MADPNSPDGPKGIYVLPNADISAIKEAHLDLAYADASAFQRLDLYLPDTPPPATGYPLIVFIHGGAWMMCDKRDVQLVPALSALERGYAVASLNYRLSSEALFPAQIFDVKASIRWLKGHAEQYRLNPNCIAAWGGSAGGHLASLLGTSDGIRELEDLDQGFREQKASVQAVVAWFAPTNFLTMDVYLSETGAGVADHTSPDSPESRLLGGFIADHPEEVAKANPETWIHAECPPFFLQHGKIDPIVPYQHSVEFAKKINAVAGPGRAQVMLLEDAVHASPHFETRENLTHVLDFLDSTLKYNG